MVSLSAAHQITNEEQLRYLLGYPSELVRNKVMNHMSVRGKAPLLGIVIKVEECYLHCAKAFKRSRLWNTEEWIRVDELPQPAKMFADHARTNEDQVAQSLKES